MIDLLADRQPALLASACHEQYEYATSITDQDFVEYVKWGQDVSYIWNGEFGSYTGVSSGELLKRDGLSVLDVGAGHGRVVAEYAKRSHEQVIGVSARNYADNPYVIEGDMHRLGALLQGNTFDVVMSCFTLLHSEEPICVLEQMADAVKPGGSLTIDRIHLSLNEFPNAAEVLGMVAKSLIGEGIFETRRLNGQTLLDIAFGHYQLPARDGLVVGTKEVVLPAMHLLREDGPKRAVRFPLEYVCTDNSWGYGVIA